MAVYNYEARNLDGTPIKNKMEAQSRDEVVASLRQRGYYPISVTQEGTGLNKNVEISILSRVSLKDISMFCRQFSFIIQSGTPMLRALELSMEQSENVKLKDILKRAYNQVQKGRALSDALRHEDDIPELMVNMIAAGESSGRLDYILKELSEYYRKLYKQKQKVSSATMYPKIVIVFSIVIVMGMVTFIVPGFIENLGSMNAELPLPTKLLVGVSNFIRNYWLLWGTALISAVGFKILVLDKDENFQIILSKRKLSGKLFGKINAQLLAGRFASTFSILLSSGLGIIQALEICSKILENKFVEKKLLQAKEDIKKGNTIGKTIEDLNVFPVMLTQMITVGEETGQLEEIMEKTAQFYDGEAEAAIEKMVTLIEPILIIVLAIIVFFIVLSLFLPMFSVMDAITTQK
ncbi:MAG: type II secretion system F family protein [Clostridium sp.]